jgi:hypothetical protein
MNLHKMTHIMDMRHLPVNAFYVWKKAYKTIHFICCKHETNAILTSALRLEYIVPD